GIGNAVFRSTNGGGSWSMLSGIAGASVIRVHPMIPTTIYAGTSSGIVRSMTGGDSWSPLGNAGLPASVLVNALVIDPTTPTTLYASVFQVGIYKSTDDGATWVLKRPEPFNHQRLAIDPVSPATLYAAGGQLLVTRDGGGNWRSLGGACLDALFFETVVVDP